MLDLHLDPAKNLITTRIAGRISVPQLASELYRTIRDPRFSPGMNGLIVAFDSDAVPDLERFSVIKPVLKAWLTQRLDARWALVLPDAETRDRAETLLADLRLGSATRCFLSESAALAWLAVAPISVTPVRL